MDGTDGLAIEVSEAGSLRLFRLAGEFDMAAVDRFERSLSADGTSRSPKVVLDMRELTFIDSSGLRAVVMADQRRRADGGRLIVVRGPARVNEVFEVTGVARHLELVDEPPAD